MRTFLAVGACALALLCSQKAFDMGGNSTLISVHERGATRTFAANEAAVQELLQACERRIVEADNVLRLAVSDGLIESLRAKELSVEIVFTSPRKFVIPFFNNRTVTATRVLIPLSGELAGDFATLFLGDPVYGHGPYRSSLGTHELVKLVNGLGSAGAL